MHIYSRRKFIKISAIGSFLGLSSTNSLANKVTPSETEGPFYPITPQKDLDFDLTTISGKDGVAKGQVVFINGQVIDQNSNPVEGATVDIWQANAAGRYRHPHDPNPAPLDPGFQGWAIVQSGKKGMFQFKTIVPGSYPVNEEWVRPPHIHFKVSKRGYSELITQMYFPENELNKSDRLLQRKPKSDQVLMIARKVSDNPYTLEYTITLGKV